MTEFYALTNQQLQEAIDKAGAIVMSNTDKTTSGEARQHAANHLKKLFEVQHQRSLIVINGNTENNVH